MAVCEVHFGNANALVKMTSAMVILPEGKTGPFPVFYLLHGLSDDHSVWVRRTSIERYVEGLPLIVVMPDGGRSFYTDAKDRPRFAYETHFIRDLMGFVDATFQTIPKREGRVIGGLSMGGYGAMKLALKHPDLFCAAVSHSGAVAFASKRILGETDWVREFVPIFGKDPTGGPEDVFALAERADRATLPALRLDCGANDFLIEDNRRFHRHLESLGIPHEYAEHPGEHNWAYWDLHVQESIAFFMNALGLKRG